MHANVPPIPPPWFKYRIDIWWRVQIMLLKLEAMKCRLMNVKLGQLVKAHDLALNEYRDTVISPLLWISVRRPVVLIEIVPQENFVVQT
jgi:hypothetical protein